MVRDTLLSQDACTHQIWDSYLKQYKRYALATNLLKARSEAKVKVTVTQKMIRDTPPSQNASTHQIWDSYLKEYRTDVPDTKRDGGTDRWTDRVPLGHKYVYV